MSSFQDLDKLIHINPEAEAQSVKNYKTDREPVLRRLRETPLGCCLRIIVKQFHPNLKKTTSSVLSVILINLWLRGSIVAKCDWLWQHKCLNTFKKENFNQKSKFG